VRIYTLNSFEQNSMSILCQNIRHAFSEEKEEEEKGEKTFKVYYTKKALKRLVLSMPLALIKLTCC